MAGRGTAIDAQFGFVEEVTYGTFVAPTRFLEMMPGESLKANVEQYLPVLLGRGATARGSNARTWVKDAGGDVPFVVQTVGFGKLLKGILGSVATTGAGDPYTHTFTPDSNGRQGLFYSVQIGRPDVSGTVQPFSYMGSKITKAKFEAAVDKELQLTVTFDSKTETTAQSLASKSFGTGAAPLIFVDGSCQINSVAQSIKSLTLEVDNGQEVNRRFIGNSKKEPLMGKEFAITGDLEFEFEGLTRHSALIAGTLLTNLVLSFMNGTHGMTITIPEMVYSPGGEPNIKDLGVVPEKMPWKALDDGTNPFTTMTYVTSDATP